MPPTVALLSRSHKVRSLAVVGSSIDLPYPDSSPPQGGSTPGVQEVLLQEGDALYVPRGWAHQATAPPADPERAASEPPPPSLHLSLGLEVEPLHDWAGAAHVALRQHVLALLAGSGSPPGTAGGLALRVADAQARHRLVRASACRRAYRPISPGLGLWRFALAGPLCAPSPEPLPRCPVSLPHPRDDSGLFLFFLETESCFPAMSWKWKHPVNRKGAHF